MSDIRVVSFKIPEKLLKEVDELAEKLGKSRTEIIRAALLKYLRKHKPFRRDGGGNE